MPFSGPALRRLLDERNTRREQLAVDIGRSCASIAGYESGRIAPPLAVIEDIARALDAPVSELIDDRVTELRRAAGLPDRVTDPDTLRRVAGILAHGAPAPNGGDA